MGADIDTSDADMASLKVRNAQADQISRAARVVLRVIVEPLTTQQEVGTCCYLLHHLLGPQCPLVGALRYQVIKTIN